MKTYTPTFVLPLLGTVVLFLCHLSSGQAPVASPIPLHDVIQVKTGGDNDGSCSRSQLNDINTWWSDSYKLLNYTLDALNDLREHSSTPGYRPQLRRYLLAFYDNGLPALDVTALQRVIDMFQGLVDFMRGAPLEGSNNWLFCDSSWQAETEVPYFPNGEPIPPKRDGTPWTIRDAPLSLKQYPVIRDKVGGVYLHYLYWTQEYKVYKHRFLNERPPPDRFGKRHYCNYDASETAKLGATQEFHADRAKTVILGRAITICPRAWTWELYQTSSLRRAIKYPRVKRPDEYLDAVLPSSELLLHELFHFVHGVDATPDLDYHYYSVLDGRDKNPETHPETNVYLAYAYYVSTRYSWGQDWATGFSKPRPAREVEGNLG